MRGGQVSIPSLTGRNITDRPVCYQYQIPGGIYKEWNIQHPPDFYPDPIPGRIYAETIEK